MSRAAYRAASACFGLAIALALLPSRVCGAGNPAEEPATPSASCPGPLTRDALLRCALGRSLEVKLAQQELSVLAGRQVAAGTLLPKHPVLAISVGHRQLFADAAGAASGSPVINWYLTLSQELEVGGQRGARQCLANLQTAAQVRRVIAAQQETAAAVLAGYYDLLASRKMMGLAEKLSHVADALSALAESRSREALLSAVEADVAQAEAVRLSLVQIEAERRSSAAGIVLDGLLGEPVADRVAGELDAVLTSPRTVPGSAGLDELLAQADAIRGEVSTAEVERAVHTARMRLLRRERIPNVTLSFIAQRDGFAEQVLGVGVSLPLFLPSPIGPSLAGEIAAETAQATQAQTTVEQVRRRVRAEVLQAYANQRSYEKELRLFSQVGVQRTHADLDAITLHLRLRELSVRESLIAQRSLIEFLQAHVKTRLAFALARVELLRATGTPLLETRL